jgi:hypothetical protein
LQLILYAILSNSKLLSNSSELSTSLCSEKIGVSGLPNRTVRFAKPDYLVCQTGLFGFGVLVLEEILCESTSRGSPDYCYSLLLFIKCLKVN